VKKIREISESLDDGGIMLINVNFNELLLELDSLSVYRNLLNDSVIKKLYELGDLIYKKEPGTDEFIKKYNEFFFELTSGSIQSLKEHIIELILLMRILTQDSQKNYL